MTNFYLNGTSLWLQCEEWLRGGSWDPMQEIGKPVGGGELFPARVDRVELE